MREESLYIPGLESGVKPRNSKSERLLSLVPLFAKGTFYFKPEHMIAQQEFLSYPRGKHDDILDAIYYAMMGIKPCRQKDYINIEGRKTSNKILDWMTL